ncbi:hypothetical protein GYA19_00705 [Candidatus Beckwithbacteria bacterium]|nr:hypothetical protein [Candidatus Beckwithbacteria bacterium]
MTKKNIFEFLKANWFLIILVVLAALLRLYNFKNTLMFLGDQARDVAIVREFLTELDPIIVGPTTSVGKIQLGPFYYYFMAPFLLLANFSPLGPALTIAFLGILTIPVLYFVIKQMFDKSTALIAATLYTFSNVIITNTRFSWNPNPMPFVIILLIWSIYQVYEHKKYQFIIWVFALFAIALQLHYMVILLAPGLVFLYLLIWFSEKKKKLLYQNTLWGFLVFFLFAVPLIIFDLVKDFLNTKGILEFVAKGNHAPRTFGTIINSLYNRIYQSIGQILGLREVLPFAKIVSYFSFVAFLLLSYFNRLKKNYQIILTLYLSGILGLVIFSGDVYEHYLGFMYPLTFIIVALLLNFVWQKLTFGKFLVAIFIFVVIFFNLKYYRFYKSLGWTIDDTQKLSKVIAEDAGSDPYNIILLDETKDYRAMQYRYFLTKTQIKDYGDFKVDTLYLISQWDYQDIETLETRELEAFFDARLMQMTKEDNARFLQDKVLKTWYFDNGPYVYKLKK